MWFGWYKKVLKSVNQLTFDKLKKVVETNKSNIENNTQRLTTIEPKVEKNIQDIATLKPKVEKNINDIQTNTNSITTINNKLSQSNFIDYKGTFNSGTTYKIADSISYSSGGKTYWFISNKNNNVGNTPVIGGDDNWIPINEPSIDINNYYDKSSINSIVNMLFPKGSLVFTYDGTTHPLVSKYSSCFEEIDGSDYTYLAIHNTTGVSGTNDRNITLQRNQLPNINLSHTHRYEKKRANSFEPWNFGTSGNVWNGNASDFVNTDSTNLYLNGNVTQQPITFSVTPKTLKIRCWKIIENLPMNML